MSATHMECKEEEKRVVMNEKEMILFFFCSYVSLKYLNFSHYLKNGFLFNRNNDKGFKLSLAGDI